MKHKDLFPTIESPDEDIGYLCWQIVKAWHRREQKIVDEFGLTPSQLEILSYIFYHEVNRTQEEITQIAISNMTGIDPMTTSTVLRTLEKKGLVTREHSKIDTRARVVKLTERSEKLVVTVMTKMKKTHDRTFNKVDQKILKEQLKVLLGIITEINNNFNIDK